MLLSRLVGPSGEVVAIERDARSINRAQTRAAEAGLHNVRFAQTDIAQFSSDASFDALVGRYILQFLPDPVGVLRSLSEKIRPGGTIAFQEGAWKPFVLLSAHSRLRSWGTSTRYSSGYKRKLHLRTPLCPGLRWWEPGATSP
jgi:trans-aconitate methyltransferase